MLFDHHPDFMIETYRERIKVLERDIERQRLLTGLPQAPNPWRRLLALAWPFRRREECPPVPPALPAATAS